MDAKEIQIAWDNLYSATNDLNKAIVLADEMMYEDKKKMKGLVRASDKTPVGAQ